MMWVFASALLWYSNHQACAPFRIELGTLFILQGSKNCKIQIKYKL